MARATILGVLGFDEKFLVRCALRAYSSSGASRLVLYVASPRDDYARQRVERAWAELKRILGEYTGILVERRDVDPMEFWDIVEAARSDIIEALKRGRAVICAGSGMRVLVVALITAALTLPKGIDPSMVEIQVDLESGEGYISYTMAEALEATELEAREHIILDTIKRLGKASVKEIHEETQIPKSTISRLTRKLEKLGYLERIGHGVYKLKGGISLKRNRASRQTL